MTSETVFLPIVGAHFRPPAKVILATIPVECPLLVRREKENPYDYNALQVLVASDAIADWEDPALVEHLENLLAPVGSDVETLRSQAMWHLGYIPKDKALLIAPIMDKHSSRTLSATFAPSPDGKPMLAIAGINTQIQTPEKDTPNDD